MRLQQTYRIHHILLVVRIVQIALSELTRHIVKLATIPSGDVVVLLPDAPRLQHWHYPVWDHNLRLL